MQLAQGRRRFFSVTSWLAKKEPRITGTCRYRSRLRFGGYNKQSSRKDMKELGHSRYWLSKASIVADGTSMRRPLRWARWSIGSRHLPLMVRRSALLPASFHKSQVNL